MTPIATDGRLSLLWRTILLLSLCVIVTQIFLYVWIQRSVNEHFEQMDAEILTHAAFNLRQYMDSNSIVDTSNTKKKPLSQQALALQNASIDYEVKTVITDNNGQVLISVPTGFINQSSHSGAVKMLWQKHHEQPFDLKINDRHYRAIVIQHASRLALIALPIDVHHQYLAQFNRQLIVILIAITFLLVSIAAFSVHLGFAPLATIRQKMSRINADQLDDRIVIADMPSELRALAESYNAMMVKLAHNFETLSRFSDDIAHELRTPLATLSTQTQVMLSKPRASNEYIEQLHHQHDTLAQLSSLINNMLLLAKTQKGLIHSQFNRVDSDLLLTKMMEYYEWIAEDRAITFKKTGGFKIVLGDESLLQRLFANLIANAVYYAASDSIIHINGKIVTDKVADNRQVLSSSGMLASYLQISFTNRLTAPMTQAEVDKLSERFYRHHKTLSMHAGSGLGLSIVHAIVNAHNGKIAITVKDGYYFEVSIKLLLA
ncbi:ATP-binding protein [Psychrobacter sp. CLB018]|uniref:ATP-binding protein n=1 Tax=Psychrobacter sp. CLB018 TaxID=3240930 RepID=UPI0035134EE8